MGVTIKRIISLLFWIKPLCGISIVYNYRIAQITRQPVSADYNKQAVVLIFDQYLKKHSGTRQNFFGGFGSFIYDFEPFYYRIDSAVSHIHEKSLNGARNFSGSAIDDLLFTFGHVTKINPQAAITISGLFGVPTHRTHELQHADFGSGQIGLGLQCDAGYQINKKHAIVGGVRYLYFVPSTGLDCFLVRHRFSVGNMFDFLISSRNNWGAHAFEFGYSVRAGFGLFVRPVLDEIEKQYGRSSFYGVYKYSYNTRHTAQRFLFNIAYGFDHGHRDFNFRHVITIWASLNVSF